MTACDPPSPPSLPAERGPGGEVNWTAIQHHKRMENLMKRTVLAVDIGAESGRVMAIHFDGQRLTAEEIYRFPNVPVEAGGTLHWDILRLWNDVRSGIAKATDPASVALDTWGVDFALLDRAGHLLGNP